MNEVYEKIDHGLTEIIYQKALVIALKEMFDTTEFEQSVPFVYKNHEVGVLRADIVDKNKCAVELKMLKN